MPPLLLHSSVLLPNLHSIMAPAILGPVLVFAVAARLAGAAKRRRKPR